MKHDSNNHSVFKLYYHLIMSIKYRRKVLNDEIHCTQRIDLLKLKKTIILYLNNSKWEDFLD